MVLRRWRKERGMSDCKNCAEYDAEKGFCPKYCEVIRRTLAEITPRWIPVSERLPEPMGWDKSYLVSLAWGGVGVMEYKSTGFHNYGSFSPVPIETVTAWMPLPEPWKEEER